MTESSGETVPPTSTSGVATSREFKPSCPRNGGIVQVSATEWCAWTGGKPQADWSGLDSSAANHPKEDFQLRPALPSSAQKSTALREKGELTKFAHGHNFLDFLRTVNEHLARTGMDTIAYLPDPEQSSQVLSIIDSYSRFVPADAVARAKSLRENKFDKYDKNNDTSATKWLLNSVDDTLKKDIQRRVDSNAGFVAHWFKLVHLIESISFSRFEKIKKDIEAQSILKIPNQDVSLLATEFLTRANELESHGHYEHRLTLVMLDLFLEGGGDSTNKQTMQYHYALLGKRSQLDAALKHIARLDRSAQDQHMINEQLTFRDICDFAEDHFKQLYDDGKWAPAKNKPDHRAPRIQTNQVSPAWVDPNSELGAVVAALLQQIGASRDKSNDTCNNCNQKGHWAADCPQLKNNNPSGPNNSFNPNRSNKKKSNRNSNRTGKSNQPAWKTKKPDESWCTKGETLNGKIHWTHKNNGLTWHWCEQCGRFSTTHWTAQHTKGKKKNRTNHLGATLDANDDDGVFLGTFHMQFNRRSIFDWLWDSMCWLLPIIFGFLCLWLGPIGAAVLWSATITNNGPSPLSALVPDLTGTITLPIPLLGFLTVLAPMLWISLGFFLGCDPQHLCRLRPRRSLKSWFHQLVDKVKPSPRHHGPKKSWHNRKRYRHHWRKPHQLFRPRLVESKRGRWNFKSTPKPPPDPRRVRSRPRWSRPPPAPDPLRLRSRPPPAPDPSQRSEACDPPNRFCSCCGTLSHQHGCRTASQPTRCSAFHSLVHGVKTALMFPQALYQQLNGSMFPIIWDSGASICLSFDRDDFVGPLKKPTGVFKTTECVGTTMEVEGVGHVAWAVMDSTGMLRTIKLKALYVPQSKVRLLSTSTLLKTYPNETITLDSKHLILSGEQGRTNSVLAPINPRNNLPTSMGHRPELTKDIPQSLNNIVTEVDHSNRNLSAAEKEWLKWHYRLGHTGFRRIQFMMRSGVLAKTHRMKALHSQIAKLTDIPKCSACCFAKARRRSTPKAAQHAKVSDHSGALKADKLHPGQEISVDHFVTSTLG